MKTIDTRYRLYKSHLIEPTIHLYSEPFKCSLVCGSKKPIKKYNIFYDEYSSVSVDGSIIDQPSHPENSVVSITHSDREGYRLIGIFVNGSEYAGEFPLTGDITIESRYEPVPGTIRTNNASWGGVMVNGTIKESIELLGEVEVSASETEIGEFLYWEHNGRPVSGETFRGTINSGDLLEAIYEAAYTVRIWRRSGDGTFDGGKTDHTYILKRKNPEVRFQIDPPYSTSYRSFYGPGIGKQVPWMDAYDPVRIFRYHRSFGECCREAYIDF